MPKEYPRSRRVGDQIQREMAELIRDELKDPRVGMVTISAVEVSHDLAHAKVFITVLGTTENLSDPAVREGTVAALGHAAGFLRHELGRRMRLRSVPQLHFIYDESVERGSRLSALIDAAVAADHEHPADDDE